MLLCGEAISVDFGKLDKVEETVDKEYVAHLPEANREIKQ
jgi:hypothetical protein